MTYKLTLNSPVGTWFCRRGFSFSPPTEQVRALTRNPADVLPLDDLPPAWRDIEWVAGDLNDPASISPAIVQGARRPLPPTLLHLNLSFGGFFCTAIPLLPPSLSSPRALFFFFFMMLQPRVE